MRHGLLELLLAASLLAGCPDDHEPAEAESTASRTAASTSTAPGPLIRADEAAGADLPPVAIRVPRLAPFSVKERLEGDRYLVLRAAAGPLEIRLVAYRDADVDAVARVARARFTPEAGVKVGSLAKWPLSDDGGPALPLITEDGAETMAWCATMIPEDDGATEGVLVIAGSGVGDGTPPDCELALGQVDLARVLGGLRVR